MSDAPDETSAIVLDYLPHGRGGDERQRFGQGALAQAIDIGGFRLYELVLEDDADVSIGDEVLLRPRETGIEEFREINYDALSSGAEAELEYVVEEAIDADPERFVRVFNEGQPITLRLHQLNLLPGIGDKLRDDILDARKREPFTDFVDLSERVPGLHNPKEVLQDRMLTELRGEDVKYALFREDGPY